MWRDLKEGWEKNYRYIRNGALVRVNCAVTLLVQMKMNYKEISNLNFRTRLIYCLVHDSIRSTGGRMWSKLMLNASMNWRYFELPVDCGIFLSLRESLTKATAVLIKATQSSDTLVFFPRGCDPRNKEYPLLSPWCDLLGYGSLRRWVEFGSSIGGLHSIHRRF